MTNDGAVGVVREALGAWDLPALSIEPLASGVNGEVFLLLGDQRRWVAKVAYASRREVEPGLAVSSYLASSPFVVAAPLPTTGGELVAMVEWSPGRRHPLAVLEFVAGDSLSHSAGHAPEVMGRVCGSLASLLRDLDPRTVGVDPSEPFVPGERNDDWNLGGYHWLDDVSDELAHRVRDVLPRVPHSVAVWDGPEILVEGDRIGLVDFGTSAWMPRVHPIARAALLVAYNDPGRLARFVGAAKAHIGLTAEEWDALELFRVVNATIYARSCAWQLTEHDLSNDHHLVQWLELLLTVIRADPQLRALSN